MIDEAQRERWRRQGEAAQERLSREVEEMREDAKMKRSIISTGYKELSRRHPGDARVKKAAYLLRRIAGFSYFRSRRGGTK